MYGRAKAWLLAFKERYKLEWLLLAAIATAAYDFFFGGKKIGVWIGEFQAQLTRDYVVPGYVLDLLIGGLLMTTLTAVGAVVVNRNQRKTNLTLKEELTEFVPARFGLTDFDFSAGDETLAGCIERADTAVNLLKHVDPEFEKKSAIRMLTRAEIDEDPSLLSPRRPFKVRPGGAVTARAAH